MTANSYPLYQALREAAGERETSRAFEAGVSVAEAYYGMLHSPQEVDERIWTMGQKVMRRDQPRLQ